MFNSMCALATDRSGQTPAGIHHLLGGREVPPQLLGCWETRGSCRCASGAEGIWGTQGRGD